MTSFATLSAPRFSIASEPGGALWVSVARAGVYRVVDNRWTLWGGLTDLPSSGENQAVARLDPQTKATDGQSLKLWMNADKLHLFDPRDGRNLAAGADATPATAGGAQESSPQSPVSDQPE